MKKVLAALSLALVLVSLTAGSAHALGIGPGRIELDFEPGMSQTFEYFILNNERKAVDVEIYVSGPLAQYITCSESTFSFAPQDVTKTFSCDMSLPESLDTPGLIDNRIGAVESMEAAGGGGATMGGRVGVESQLWITVPYPGYYAVVGLDAPNTASGSDVVFKVSVNNKGTNTFTASGTIKVFDGDLELDSLDLGQRTLKPTQSGTLTVSWPTGGISAGQYRAVATVNYGDKSEEAEKTFSIGELRAEITGIDKAKVPLGNIAKFTAGVESVWNEPIEGMHVTIDVMKIGGGTLVSGKSETFSLAGWEKKDILVYVDASGLDSGVYDVRATLHYLNVTSSKDVLGGLEVTSFIIDAPTALVIIIILLAVTAVFVYIKRRKVRRR